VRNTSSDWCPSVMREVTAHRLANVDHPTGSSGVHLVEPHRPGKKLYRVLHKLFADTIAGVEPIFHTANVVRLNPYERCSKGDVVLFSTDGNMEVGRVEVNASITFGATCTTFSVITPWVVLSDSRRCWKCKASADSVLVESADIVCTLIWGGSPDMASVLKPTHV